MPFSPQDFFAVFAQYNQEVWPMPIVTYVMGVTMVGLLFWESHASAILIPTFLAAFWVINGLGYHGTYFVRINPAASAFAAVFVLQAFFLGVAPVIFGDLRFRVRRDARSLAGLALIVFAVLVYPLWGRLAGHLYPAVPVFGLAPCPTTIFTIGMLLLAKWSAARWLLVVPAVWAAIGGSAAVVLGVPQDWGLIAALLVLAVFGGGHWRNYPFARHKT